LAEAFLAGHQVGADFQDRPGKGEGRAAGADDAAKKKVMERMNEILNRRSYIRNLVNGVRAELVISNR
jgi:hypothetical protein